ncbi:uncharacterized protein LOC113561913 [Ooceraea biroi]|uniref:uncharacterized protein LOC113561913 n=1 Tax=Ooceraea biroi TaxID=2015173 RepID=UPI000F09083D|nr:uncharacterized protein LOC113561913 [Ooceraea biroi]
MTTFKAIMCTGKQLLITITAEPALTFLYLAYGENKMVAYRYIACIDFNVASLISRTLEIANWRLEFDESKQSRPRLLSWLAPDPTGCTTRAYCKYCKCSLLAHKKDLLNHCKSSKHERHVKLDKEAKLDKYINITPHFTDTQKRAELKLSIFIAEHSSISTVNHLCELLPKIDSNSTILSNLRLHKTKCRMLLKKVIAPCMFLELVEDIADSLFSIIVDESTDLASDKVMCIMIKYYSVKRKEIITTFYRLILLERCDAESLFTVVKQQLLNDNLKLKNLIGIGVDGANVMVGQHSFATLWKKEVPDIVVVKCVCYSLHLCAEKACQALLKRLEFFVREVHNYFSHSPKRIIEYRNLCLQLKGDVPNKVAKLSGT